MDATIQPPGGTNSPQLNLQAQANLQSKSNESIQQLSLNRLPIGTIIQGLVVGNDKNGNVIVRLAGNDLLLSSPIALNKNAQIQLKIDNVSGSITAQLISVDGKLPPTQPQQLSSQLHFNNPNANNAHVLPQLKPIALQAPGTTKPVNDSVQANAVHRPEAYTVSTSQAGQIKAIVINPTPEVLQGVRANMSLSNNEKVQNSKFSQSMPEELKPGTQINIKITGTQPPANNPQTAMGSIPTEDGIDPQTKTDRVVTENKTLAKQDWMQTSPMKEFMPSIKTLSNGNLQINALVIDSKQNGEILVETKLGKMIVEGMPRPGVLNQPTALQETLTKNLVPGKAQNPINTNPASNLTNTVSNTTSPNPTGTPVPNIPTAPLNTTTVTNNILPGAAETDTPEQTNANNNLIAQRNISTQPNPSIPRGTIMMLELTEFIKSEIVGEHFKSESPLTRLASEWTTLKEMVTKSAENGSHQLPNKLAGTDSNFAAKLVNFINAVKNNDPEAWIGRNYLSSLGEDLSSQLIGKLKADFSALRGLFTEQPHHGWQSFLFPVFDGKELHQARLHVKDLPERKKSHERKTGTRFIMEVETTYFGEMQFDGLVRKTDRQHFDLIIRSHKDIEKDIQLDIKQIFITASEITGFRGELEFASMREFPVKPFEEVLEADINKHISHDGFEV